MDRAATRRVIEAQPARQARKRFLYDSKHRAMRARLAQYVDAGVFICPRCRTRIMPGDTWDLGHSPDGPRPEHAACNRGAR